MEGRRVSIDLSVIRPVGDPVTSVASHSTLVSSIGDDVTTTLVINVFSATLNIDARVLLDLNERCRSILQTCLTWNIETEKKMLVRWFFRRSVWYLCVSILWTQIHKGDLQHSKRRRCTTGGTTKGFHGMVEQGRWRSWSTDFGA